MTTFFVVSGVGQALAGFVVDRVGALRVLCGGRGAARRVGPRALASAQSYAMLLVAAAVAGLGNSVFHPADFTLLNRRVSTPRLGHAFSVHGLVGQPRLGRGAGLRARRSRETSGWRAAVRRRLDRGLPRARLPLLQPRACSTTRSCEPQEAAKRTGGSFAFLGVRRGVDVLRLLPALGDGVRRAAELRAADPRAHLRRDARLRDHRASPRTCSATPRARPRAASSPRRASTRTASWRSRSARGACARSRSPRALVPRVERRRADGAHGIRRRLLRAVARHPRAPRRHQHLRRRRLRARLRVRLFGHRHRARARAARVRPAHGCRALHPRSSGAWRCCRRSPSAPRLLVGTRSRAAVSFARGTALDESPRRARRSRQRAAR